MGALENIHFPSGLGSPAPHLLEKDADGVRHRVSAKNTDSEHFVYTAFKHYKIFKVKHLFKSARVRNKALQKNRPKLNS